MKKESARTVSIIGALVVAIAPHTPGLPLWINVWCIVMWGYMLVRLKTGWPLPATYIRYGLTFAGIFGLLLTYSVRIGADAFLGLLALMAAIKPFEMATHRHQMITVLLTYFIIITSLFRSESMFIVLYMFFSVLVTTMALVQVNAPGNLFRESFKLAARIFIQAFPLMVLLFLLFPRFPGSLFGIEDKTMGRTGFSDHLSLGGLVSLVRDQTPAFRVEFKGASPLADKLYWRGIVFQKFDGKTWTTQDQLAFNLSPLSFPGKYYNYTILLEPHNSPWLMALDLPIKGPSWAGITGEQVLKSRRPVKKRVRYMVSSFARDFFDEISLPGVAAGGGFPGGPSSVSDHMPGLISPEEMAAAIISTAGNKNPRARALAETLAGKTASVFEKIHLLLSYFKENEFVYSLDTPRTTRHPIDTFLFESKKGYCEHYASALGFMMNVLGVPARVVGGYLGGEYNPYSNYLTVRQSYAHVWVEIFDQKNGWVRVDPTMAVAPERIGINPDGSLASFSTSTTALSFSRKIKFALDAVNLRWKSWFTGYSYFEQKAFLEKLGLSEKWRGFVGISMVLAMLLLGILTGVAGFLFWLFQLKKDRPDPVEQAYLMFCCNLGKLGLRKRPDQGPMDFARDCGNKRPDLREKIMMITDHYVQLRFQKDCPETTLEDFKTCIKNLK
ncbi:MAG: DUF3488 domain-containing transglutaminase family protein [Desulfobacteraceae bacterium]|nr:DUF3488 domain-containing transglutaminase family protein [Desulfobacteraceae bacterium]